MRRPRGGDISINIPDIDARDMQVIQDACNEGEVTWLISRGQFDSYLCRFLCCMTNPDPVFIQDAPSVQTVCLVYCRVFEP